MSLLSCFKSILCVEESKIDLISIKSAMKVAKGKDKDLFFK
jgi:hypothetical protein